VRIDGEHFDALAADLEQAMRELEALLARDAALWRRGRPGKWTAGQHVEHLAICVEDTAGAYERAAADLHARTLAPAPRRGLLQRLWVALVLGRGTMPRGGRAPKRLQATAQPEREPTLARLRRAADRHRALGATLTPAERDRVWAPNPFLRRWHYTLSETLREHAVHIRHHAKLIAEIPGTPEGGMPCPD